MVGGVVSIVPAAIYSWNHYTDSRTMALPFPHHIPKTPGGVSLRFAMVQDVIHERFARHGRAYYAERNRRAREDLAGLEIDVLLSHLASAEEQVPLNAQQVERWEAARRALPSSSRSTPRTNRPAKRPA